MSVVLISEVIMQVVMMSAVVVSVVVMSLAFVSYEPLQTGKGFTHQNKPPLM